jgi:hypothetical protein
MNFLLNFLVLNSRLRRKAFFAAAHVDFRAICGMREFTEFEFRIKIKDEGLDVVGALLKVPENLVATGLVVEHLDNSFAFNVLATGSRIL